MQRIRFLSLFSALVTATLLLNGCSRQPATKIIVIQQPPAPAVQQPDATAPAAEALPLRPLKPDDDAPSAGAVILQDQALPLPEPSRQEKYDTSLLEALHLVADRKYPAAMTALEAARAVQDTEQVRQEIDSLKRRMEEQAAAERTVADVQAVLKDGRPEEAARLALAALQQYGGSDSAAELTRIKLQADALVAARTSATSVQRTGFRQEGETALREGNLRAALVAFDQALQSGVDTGLRRQAEEIRGTLTRYDDCRGRAAVLRRDPARFEEALDLLRQAAAAWDTPQIRQEIDDCNLALQNRRERLSVADFEVRGEIGLPQAGRTLAEELLPAFKGRFDLVERGQLGKVLEELRLENTELADNRQACQEVSRLAKLRYLVVGSITPLCGITVQARLVDVRTGLVVQTARLVVATPAELIRGLPRLAALLMMSDEQKLAFEQQLAQQRAAEVQAIAVAAPLPPPPPPPEAGQVAPPPVIAYTYRPPALGGLVVEDFQRLPPASPLGLAVEVGVVREDPCRQRLLRLSIELGDNLFRRGRYAEAHRHFELALTLSSHRQEIEVRLDRCRPHVPPPSPPPVIVAPVAVAVVTAPPIRPRLVVFNFLVNCEPGLVPPALGDWAAENLAAYFAPRYEVLERGEVCWYMGRLGITMRDVLYNPGARLALAQALNVRYFVFGAIRQTASFNVDTHLIDAQSGQRQGGGSIHVQDQQELKLRLQELARQTATSPGEQVRLAQEGKDNEKALNEARHLVQSGKYAQAAEVCRAALQRSPDNVALQTLLQQAEKQALQAELQAARQAEDRRRQAEATRKRQEELAQQAEAARRKAEQEAKARDQAARRAQEVQRQQAYEQQLALGRRAMQQANFVQAVALLESAIALNPTDMARRDLAQAKAKAAEAAHARASQEEERREAEQRRQREAELAKVRQRVAEERQRRETDETARRKAQELHDQTEHTRLLDQAKQSLARQQYEPALAALQSARQLRSTEEVARLISQAQEGQVRAAAQKKDAQARAAVEKQIVEEQARRQKAEAEIKQKQQAYQAALEQARKALAEKRYDLAQAKFQDAGKLFSTDAVLSGLKQVQEARAAAQVAPPKPQPAPPKLESPPKSAAPQPQPQSPPAKPPTAPPAASPTPQSKPQPTPPQSKPMPPQLPPPPPEYTQQIQAAAKSEQQQKYEEALKAYQQALKLLPGDAKATNGVAFSQRMIAGQKAHTAKRFPEAVREYEAALKLSPGHIQATDALKRARLGKP